MSNDLAKKAADLGLDPDDSRVMADLKRVQQQPAWGLRANRTRQKGKVNRLAAFALFCSLTVPILGIVFGILALQEIDDTTPRERGAALAQWAIGLGAVVMLLLVLIPIAVFVGN